MNIEVQEPSKAKKKERPKNPRIDLDKVRKTLPPFREPYYVKQLGDGLVFGFRKTEKGGYWSARQYVNKHHKTTTLGSERDVTYTDAMAAAIVWGQEIRDGVGSLKNVKTVRDVLAIYWISFCIGKKEKKLVQTRSHLDCHILNKPIADMQYKDVVKLNVREWWQSLINTKNSETPLSPASMNRILKTFRAGLNYGVDELKLVTETRADQWNKIDLMVVDNRPKFVLDKGERDLLVESSDSIIKPFFRAMCILPIRPDSYAQCMVKDLDDKIPGKRFLNVYDEKVKKYRNVPLTPDTYAFLKKQTRFKGPNDYLFTDENGKPWDSTTWRRPMEKARAAAGLNPKTSVYTLRRSVITYMIVHGQIDVLTVARLAGTSVEYINKNYGQLLPDEAVEKMIALAL
jgi:integrase